MNRRALLQTLFAGGAIAALNACRDDAHAQAAPGAAANDKVRALQVEWRSFLSAGATVPAPGDALKLTDAQWKSRLDAEQYGVLRREGTERPGSSPLNREKRPGIYACA